jgi:hypothetical protein
VAIYFKGMCVGGIPAFFVELEKCFGEDLSVLVEWQIDITGRSMGV